MAVSRASSVTSDEGSEVAIRKRQKWHRRFAEQRLEGKRPVLTARAAQAYFVFATVLCIALGVPILVSSLNTVQYRIPYAFEGPMAMVQGSQERQQLLWAAGDTGLVYNLSIAIDKDMSPPIYVFFELSSFFQNYRRYVRSYDAKLMHNGGNTSSPASACQPYSYIGPPDTNPGSNSSLYANGAINPCGQIAQSFFNDTYEISVSAPDAGAPAVLQLDESSIAWSNDYKLYGDFIPWNYNDVPEWRGGGTVKQPLNTAQHWMVWMRNGAHTVITKLYAQINQQLPAGTNLTLLVHNRYNTYGFQGEKAVIVTTNSWVGGRNIFLGAFYLACAGACACAALFFFLAHDLGLVWKRQPGRLADLSWVRGQPDELTRATSVADLELRFSQGSKHASSGPDSLDGYGPPGEALPTGVAAATAAAAAAAAGGPHTVQHIQADGQILADGEGGTGASGSGQTSSDQEAPAGPQQQQQQQPAQQHFR